MASNYTSNYNLCQWGASDKVLRTEFNADNAKIDAAIKAVDGRVTSVSNSKASNSALNSLSGTVSGLSAALAQKGNCRVTLERYTGTGSASHTRTFPGKPLMVILYDGASMIMAAPGMTTVYKRTANASSSMSASWSGNSLTLATSADPNYMLNSAGASYYCLALFDAEAE